MISLSRMHGESFENRLRARVTHSDQRLFFALVLNIDQVQFKNYKNNILTFNVDYLKNVISYLNFDNLTVTIVNRRKWEGG